MLFEDCWLFLFPLSSLLVPEFSWCNRHFSRTQARLSWPPSGRQSEAPSSKWIWIRIWIPLLFCSGIGMHSCYYISFQRGIRNLTFMTTPSTFWNSALLRSSLASSQVLVAGTTVHEMYQMAYFLLSFLGTGLSMRTAVTLHLAPTALLPQMEMEH